MEETRTLQHRGFTLVELLVVITIIGVLVALTVPAVQSARESSRLAQCQNNLKQFGIAINSYVTQVDAFPIGYIAWANAPGGAAPGWAWSTAILSQLEQSSIAGALNINLPIDFAANDSVRTTALAVYVCPRDRNTGDFRVKSTITGGMVEARTISYAANQGTDDSPLVNGLFQSNKSFRARDVKDGLSNTFAVGERGSFVVQNAWPGAMGDGRGGVEVLAIVSQGGPDPRNSSPSSFCGLHFGGTCFLMADGSVRLIKATIAPAVYRALATRNGKEVIDQGAY